MCRFFYISNMGRMQERSQYTIPDIMFKINYAGCVSAFFYVSSPRVFPVYCVFDKFRVVSLTKFSVVFLIRICTVHVY